MIGKQIHRWSIPIPFLLSSYLFGENFEKLNTVAVVKTTKKTRLIHIWSNERAMSMLSIENKNAVRFMKKDKMYYACAKIFIFFTEPIDYYGETNGYVIRETTTKWVVKTANDLELLVTYPTLTFPIDKETNCTTYCWVFQSSRCSFSSIILHVCLLLSLAPSPQLQLHRRYGLTLHCQ